MPTLFTDEALDMWSSGHDEPHPLAAIARLQRAWDNCRVQVSADSLLTNAPDTMARARLLATSTK